MTGARLRSLRRRAGLTQGQLGDIARMHPNTLSRLEGEQVIPYRTSEYLRGLLERILAPGQVA